MSHILIVEDDEQSRYLLQFLLEERGHQVTAAANGAEALRGLDTALPDLVISDILMPVMDGFTLCRHWRADERTRDIPFVFYTATYTDPKDEKLAMDLGADRFVCKPQEPSVLVNLVAEVLAAKPSSRRETPAIDESLVLREYNEALVRKLEKKLLDLEDAHQALQQQEHSRRLVAEELRASEERYTRLFDVMRDAFFEADMQGRLLQSNPAYRDLLGYTERELTKLSYYDITPKSWHALEEAIFTEQLLQLGYSEVYEKQFQHKDGTIVPVELRVFLLRNEQDHPTSMWGIVRDISKRKEAEARRDEAEAALRHAQKMEAVGLLAGGIAHDFNNLLSVILGCAELSLEQLDPPDPVYADLLEIKKVAERSASLTRQLLSFSRKQQSLPRVVDLAKIVTVQQSMLCRLIGESIDIRFDADDDLWPIRIDPSHLDQILANLAINARDAIAGSGTVTIRATNKTLVSQGEEPHGRLTPGEYVLLTFRDTGTGIAPETLEHVFEPFFTTKERGRGTGLGLSTIYGIVKQAGGEILVDSELGRGTTFRIYFPRHRGALDPQVDSTSMANDRGGETILIVEDERTVLDLTGRILRRHGYTILSAQSPSAARQLAEEHGSAIDLLLTDVVMPGMNGPELRASLADRFPKIKVLYMSGYPGQVGAADGLLGPDDPFLAKPFRMDQLAGTVRNVLDS